MRIASLEEFARDPLDRFVTGDTFAHFCATPELWGILLWGRPSSSDARALGRSLVLELAPPAVPHASLVDASRLEGGDEGALENLRRYVTHYGEALSEWVKKLALIRPGGLRGAIVSGAYEVVPRPYPVAVFDDLPSALAWLDVPNVSASDLAETMASTFEIASSTSRVVAELRSLLDKNLRGSPVAEAAKTLGMAERTLQRKLGEAGTTFQDELLEARVRAGKRMLLETDEPLTTIALDVGCASLQHFSALFRKRTGLSPSEWRKKARERR